MVSASDFASVALSLGSETWTQALKHLEQDEGALSGLKELWNKGEQRLAEDRRRAEESEEKRALELARFEEEEEKREIALADVRSRMLHIQPEGAIAPFEAHAHLVLAQRSPFSLADLTQAKSEKQST